MDAVKKAQQIAQQQLQTFTKECFLEKTKPLVDTIHCNAKKTGINEKWFRAILTTASKGWRGVTIWKTSFSMRTKYGLQRCPMEEDDDLVLRVTFSHVWRTCLHLKLRSPYAICIVLDGAVIIQMMKPAAAKTFDEFAQQVFIPYISSRLRGVSHVDLVWDT